MKSNQLFVGTYTRETAARGIYGVDRESRQATLLTPCENPSFLARHPQLELIYAVSEIADHEGQPSGAIEAYAVDDDGHLKRISQQSSMGADPCHICIAPTSKYLAVSNYTGGTLAVFPLESQGHIQNLISLVQHKGDSIIAQRQSSAHVHSSLLNDTGEFLMTADLGADQLVRYSLSPEGLIDPDYRLGMATIAGSGPRMMINLGDSFLLVNELSNLLSEHRWHDLVCLQSASCRVADAEGENIASHIAASRDGRFAYVSNRGDDNLAVFDLEDELTPIQWVATGGRHPRHFTLSPDETELYVANMLDDEIRIFARNPLTGELTDRNEVIRVPSPTCLLF